MGARRGYSLRATQESPAEMFYKNNESDRALSKFGRTKWLYCLLNIV